MCMNVKTIEKNLKLAKSLLPFASRTVQSSLPPKLKHVELILAACQEEKASMLKCYIKCRAAVHDMIQFRKTLSMLPPELAHHSLNKRQKIAQDLTPQQIIGQLIDLAIDRTFDAYEAKLAASRVIGAEQLQLQHLVGTTAQVRTPYGRAFVTVLRTWHKACDFSVRTKDDEWVVKCIRLSSKVPIAHISEHNKFLRAVKLQFSLDNKMEVPDTQLVKVGDRVVLRSREPDHVDARTFSIATVKEISGNELLLWTAYDDDKAWYNVTSEDVVTRPLDLRGMRLIPLHHTNNLGDHRFYSPQQPRVGGMMYFPLISVGAGTKGVELAFAHAVRQAGFNVPPSVALFASVDDDSQTNSSTTAVDETHIHCKGDLRDLCATAFYVSAAIIATNCGPLSKITATRYGRSLQKPDGNLEDAIHSVHISGLR